MSESEELTILTLVDVSRPGSAPSTVATHIGGLQCRRRLETLTYHYCNAANPTFSKPNTLNPEPNKPSERRVKGSRHVLHPTRNISDLATALVTTIATQAFSLAHTARGSFDRLGKARYPTHVSISTIACPKPPPYPILATCFPEATCHLRAVKGSPDATFEVYLPLRVLSELAGDSSRARLDITPIRNPVSDLSLFPSSPKYQNPRSRGQNR